MGFVWKIAKTTENPAIKYKSLKHSGLYLVFHRFSILFIDLITIHEVLPHHISPRPVFLSFPSSVSASTILSSTPLIKVLLPGVE